MDRSPAQIRAQLEGIGHSFGMQMGFGEQARQTLLSAIGEFMAQQQPEQTGQ